MKSFLLQLTFLTRIPLPFSVTFDEKQFAKGIIYFPLIGLIIGGALYCMTYLTPWMPAPLIPIAYLIGYLTLTGGLHLDGLADVWDGVNSHRDSAKIFDIMKDSRIGAFGAIGLLLYFFVFYAALSTTTPWVILTFPIVGRVVAMCAASFSTYAKASGLGLELINYARPIHGLIGIVSVSILLGICGLPYLIAFGITLCYSAYKLWYFKRLLGGITGDLLGYFIETSQIIYMALCSVLLFGGIL